MDLGKVGVVDRLRRVSLSLSLSLSDRLAERSRKIGFKNRIK